MKKINTSTAKNENRQAFIIIACVFLITAAITVVGLFME